MGGISHSLVHYTNGNYWPGDRLRKFVRAHLDGYHQALRQKIMDDGGAVGREIITALKAAEEVYQSGKASVDDGIQFI